MGLVILSQPLTLRPSLLSLHLRRSGSSSAAAAPPPRIRCCFSPLRRLSSRRFDNLKSKCSITRTDVDLDVDVKRDEVSEDLPSIPLDCSFPILHLDPEILETGSMHILAEGDYLDNLLTELPVLSEEEQQNLAATPAHPTGLYALYAISLVGSLVEQLWKFAWPASVALLHPSLLPVAVVDFFAKLAIFVGGPLVGNLMDSFPRVPAYNYLSLIQTAAQLLSATMIIYALRTVPQASATSVLIRPWFIILVLAGAIERLSGLVLGVAMERDWVVLLAGTNRPIALAQANAMLNRLDLICEIAGTSLFGILLSKYAPVTCLKLAAGLMIWSLPVLIILGQLANKLSSGVLDRSKFPQNCDNSETVHSHDVRKLVENGLGAIKYGWIEYKCQPVLPASVASVLLYFNVALAPGALMTAFLTHRGISPSIIGGFNGLCAFMGVTATFLSACLVKHLGILKAGAAGLMFQALLLTVAVVVYWSGSLSQQTPLLLFLGLIILSRLGHMSYDVVGTQILQTGIPETKANLIGTTEISMASLAEFIMLGVAIIANDISHFGFLAMLSVSSVVGAAWMFSRWLANPTDEQRKLFSFDLLRSPGFASTFCEHAPVSTSHSDGN
ncbi:hypothetical protein QJS10_CPA05g00203 [Acorus calamus]|uniref:Solute carrier family 40 member n=1 Tax=Acorus calamus TaxID=4465 RepID=A0AAV9EQY9_ACOCL|nr:hypothetical protein QJS10_CPA05g00203 [Acorus calamus]